MIAQRIRQLLRSTWKRAISTPSDEHAVHRIRELAVRWRCLPDDAIRLEVERLRHTVRNAAAHCEPALLPGCALVVEAARRTIGIDFYDVQLLAGLALCRGTIVEMQTGEGKTFAALFPAAVHALAGRGVHVMTANAYLAARDHELLAPVFAMLGLSAGRLTPAATTQEKTAAYACDVTYGAGYAFGFDYLRDQTALLARRRRGLGAVYRDLLRGDEPPSVGAMQRGHAFAIVDEVDSVLIDEATMPLILTAGPSQAATNPAVFVQAQRVAEQMLAGKDYTLDPAAHAVRLTSEGTRRSFHWVGEVSSGLERPWPQYVEAALRAKHLLRCDVDYLVDDGRVLLVDGNTGRVFEDRSWRDGLQQAIEAREGVAITAEKRPLARISRQRYFRLYDHLCGMTGTARDSERELRQVYHLPVVVIPPRKPCQRKKWPTRCFADEATKFAAIVEDIRTRHASGQPILVGTRTIEKSEALAVLLAAENIPFQLLNGKQDADEAAVIAAAGQPGTITIATNMAGRGTDIPLGKGVAGRDGLHVIASEPHESARIDRQLIGRAARQGDPGSCQSFASADDRLFSAFAWALSQRIRRRAGASGEIVDDLTSLISRVQSRVERHRRAVRRQLFAQEEWWDGLLEQLSGAS